MCFKDELKARTSDAFCDMWTARGQANERK